MAKAGFKKKKTKKKKKTLFTSKAGLNLRKKLLKRYAMSTAMYGAQTWTLRRVIHGKS
jgi:hypothetical protein